MRFIFALTMLAMLILVLFGGFMLCKFLLPNPVSLVKHTTNYITNTQMIIKVNYKTNYVTNSNEIIKEITITEKESVTNTVLYSYEVRKDNTVGLGINNSESIIIYTHRIYSDFSLGAGLRFNYFTFTNFAIYVFLSYSF
jgi:hypothetical protein